VASFKHEEIRTNIISVESVTEIDTAIHDADQPHWCAGTPPGRRLRKFVLDDATAIRRFRVQILNGSYPAVIHEFYQASVGERIIKTLIARNSQDRNLTGCIKRAWNGLDAK